MWGLKREHLLQLPLPKEQSQPGDHHSRGVPARPAGGLCEEAESYVGVPGGTGVEGAGAHAAYPLGKQLGERDVYDLPAARGARWRDFLSQSYINVWQLAHCFSYNRHLSNMYDYMNEK